MRKWLIKLLFQVLLRIQTLQTPGMNWYVCFFSLLLLLLLLNDEKMLEWTEHVWVCDSYNEDVPGTIQSKRLRKTLVVLTSHTVEPGGIYFGIDIVDAVDKRDLIDIPQCWNEKHFFCSRYSLFHVYDCFFFFLFVLVLFTLIWLWPLSPITLLPQAACHINHFDFPFISFRSMLIFWHSKINDQIKESKRFPNSKKFFWKISHCIG